jgi:hypothetical protein
VQHTSLYKSGPYSPQTEGTKVLRNAALVNIAARSLHEDTVDWLRELAVMQPALLGLLLYPENGDRSLLRNVNKTVYFRHHPETGSTSSKRSYSHRNV